MVNCGKAPQVLFYAEFFLHAWCSQKRINYKFENCR